MRNRSSSISCWKFSAILLTKNRVQWQLFVSWPNITNERSPEIIDLLWSSCHVSSFFLRIVSSTETNKVHRSNVRNINLFKVLNIPIINPFWLIFEWNSNQVFMREFDQFFSLLSFVFQSRGTLSYGKFNHEVYKRGEFSMFYSLKISSWWKSSIRLQTTWKSSFVWHWFESDRSTTSTRSTEKCRLCFAINSSLIFVTFKYFFFNWFHYVEITDIYIDVFLLFSFSFFMNIFFLLIVCENKEKQKILWHGVLRTLKGEKEK